jgi:hypothetical protein
MLHELAGCLHTKAVLRHIINCGRVFRRESQGFRKALAAVMAGTHFDLKNSFNESHLTHR